MLNSKIVFLIFSLICFYYLNDEINGITSIMEGSNFSNNEFILISELNEKIFNLKNDFIILNMNFTTYLKERSILINQIFTNKFEKIENQISILSSLTNENKKKEIYEICEHFFQKKLDEEIKAASKSCSEYLIKMNEINIEFEEKYNVVNKATLENKATIIKHHSNNNTWTSYSVYENIFYYINPFGNVDNIIDENQDFKACWHINDNKGVFSIKLNEENKPFGFGIEHLLQENNDNAIKNFTIYGLHFNNIWLWDYLGSFLFTAGNNFGTLQKYNSDTDTIWKSKNNKMKQYFVCKIPNCQNKYQYYRIEFSNHGNLNSTCIYRFEIYVKK